jgi:LysM repeat protein
MYCKRCGTPLRTGVVICPECGARQRRQASSVRCASCHSRVPVSLSLCPHCGRDLRPAGPRWGVWLAVAIGLALMVLWGLGKLPVEQIGQDVIGARAKVARLVQVLGPAPTTEPSAGKPGTVARATATTSPESPAATEQPEVASEPEVTEIVEGTEGSFGEPSATAAVTETLAAATPGTPITATLAAVPTLVPSLAPTATATAVPPTAPQPAPTATVKPAKATGSQANTYRVRSGDTLSGIAQQFKVGLDALLAANGITANTTLRIGQELVIPGAGVPPAPTATPKPRATPTPAKPVLPPTPAPYLPTPKLTGPGDKASSTGETAQIFLSWDAVPGMTADDRYQVAIRWVEQGALQEKSDLFWTGTNIQVPPWLWGRADQPEREYQWFVRAVRLSTDGQGGEIVIPLSPASEIRNFYWN